jgi:hypothetical protein
MCIESAGDRPTYDVLMPRLVATLPGNYFYAGRYGQNRLDRGRVREVLPYLTRAAARPYGQNRLKVAWQHLKAPKHIGPADVARHTLVSRRCAPTARLKPRL